MDVHLVCKQCTPLPCFYFTLVHDLWMLVKPYQGMTLVTTVNCLFSLNVYELNPLLIITCSYFCRDGFHSTRTVDTIINLALCSVPIVP